MIFYNRRRVYLIVIIVLVLLIPFIYLLFSFSFNDLYVDANLTFYQNKPFINVTLKNESSHVINNISISVNDKEEQKLESLKVNDIFDFNFSVSTETINVKIIADKQTIYDNMFTINKSNLGADLFDFNPTYLFKDKNQISEIGLTICNNGKLANINVDIETEAELKQGEKIQELSLGEQKCETLAYKLLYAESGEKKVKFKIYNDVYSKELLVSGSVH